MATERPAKFTESEAGRRFLDALRQSQTKDKTIKVVTPTAQDDYQIAALGFGLQPTIDPNATNVNELKRKRMSLRNTLEELLVEYLGSLSSEDNTHSARYRAKRSLAAVTGDIETLEQYQEIDPNIDIEVKTADNNSSHADIREKAKNSTKVAEVCAEQRRRITQLDRNELNAALQEVPSNQHNIRRHLNYR